MGTKRFKPVTPSRRLMSASDFAEITSDTPEKSLLRPLRSKGGRNNLGRMTVRHQGGGHKRRYRMIDFRRDKVGIPGTIATIEYDPNRTARIALVTTRTARSATSWPRTAWRSAARSSRTIRRTSSLATASS